MKNILFLATFAICSILQAQETLQNNSPSDTSSSYLIKLKDNTSLSGKIIEQSTSEIKFNDLTIGKVTIPVTNIKSIIRLSGDQLCILTTTDGKTFTGYLIAQSENEITIKTESLGTLTISNSKIRDIKLVEKEQLKNGRYYFPNPHPTRYFFAPSAIALKKGEGYYQNAYVLANSVQFGISDHFSMGGGIVIPVLFFITPKVSYKISDNLYAGGGILAATTLSKDFAFGIGVGYGSVTVGNTESNLTVSAGWGALKQKNDVYNAGTGTYTSKTAWEASKRPMFVFSGMTRIAPKVALVTENWVFATKDDKYDNNGMLLPSTINYHSVLTFGFRLMGEKNSFDLALAVPSLNNSSSFGLPYLDYVFKF
jgi:hypothetical protein